jgi:hypothetical protein
MFLKLNSFSYVKLIDFFKNYDKKANDFKNWETTNILIYNSAVKKFFPKNYSCCIRDSDPFMVGM